MPDNTLRVLQITDCHVSAAADTPYRGLNARAEFEKLLPAARTWSPDLLLLTGDLAEDGSDEATAWLAARLGEFGVPMLAVPGNHDEAEVLAQHFPLSSVDAPLVHDVGDWRLVLLNSARRRKIDGHLDDDQLDALAAAVNPGSGPAPDHALVALHHQPLPVGSPWIDRYPLQSPERFWSALEGSRCRAVCWGHVHQALELETGQVNALAGPSTAANSLPGMEKFTLDPRGPACRGLLLGPSGQVSTEVIYAEG